MSIRHICVIYSKGNSGFGIDIRAKTIISQLREMGIEICERTVREYLWEDNHPRSGVCVISYVNAWLTFIARFRGDVVWLDSMDSRKLTIKWQLKSKNPLNWLRATRSIFLGLFVNRAHLVTYICLRDQSRDKPKIPAFAFANRLPEVINTKSTTKRFAVMGDWRYFPNRQGLSNFLKKVWTPLQTQLVDIKLHVYGKELSHKLINFENVKYEGFRKEDQIYTSSTVFLTTIEIGSGVKNKTTFPLAAGCYVISLPEGAIDCKPNPNLEVVENFEEMKNSILRISKHWPSPKKLEAEVTETKDLLSRKKLVFQTFWPHESL